MPILDNLKALGVDTNDPLAVARMVAALSLTNQQKNTLLAAYLKESGKRLTPEARKVATFYKGI